MSYLRLLRPRDWIKNLFLLIPSFFAGDFFNTQIIMALGWGLISFSCIASSIYIINDYKDINDDSQHPEKCMRPLASGEASKRNAVSILLGLAFLGFILAWQINHYFLLISLGYFLMNLGYSFGLKQIPILDILIIAIGFVLRIEAGAIIGGIFISEWIIIMVFLLALFLAIGKRRDDVLLKLTSGIDMRESIRGYNLELLNILLAVICGVIIVAYLMYSISHEAILRLGSNHLYYTCFFVIAGIMRYLQIIFVSNKSGSPTDILYKDRFIQITLLLWIISFMVIIYFKNITPILQIR